MKTCSTNLARHEMHRGRRASTLVEMTVVVALMGIMMGCIVAFLSSIQRYDVSFRQHGVRSEQSLQLAEAIRTDIRKATAISLQAIDADADEMLLIDSAEGMQIRYELDPEGCRRLSGPTNITTSTELFRIGPTTPWKLETAPPGRRPLYNISLQWKSAIDGEPNSTALFVSAALGADTSAGATQ